jgi:1,4-dihydroxy-2-naphthoyl-CoA synthase
MIAASVVNFCRFRDKTAVDGAGVRQILCEISKDSDDAKQKQQSQKTGYFSKSFPARFSAGIFKISECDEYVFHKLINSIL